MRHGASGAHFAWRAPDSGFKAGPGALHTRKPQLRFDDFFQRNLPIADICLDLTINGCRKMECW
jgi:hypothetical protein